MPAQRLVVSTNIPKLDQRKENHGTSLVPSPIKVEAWNTAQLEKMRMVVVRQDGGNSGGGQGVRHKFSGEINPTSRSAFSRSDLGMSLDKCHAKEDIFG